MIMKIATKLAAVALLVSLPISAEAHRIWMLPSATVLSGDDPWVTVDAAVSNDLFYFEHFPLRLANIGAEEGGEPAAGAKGAKGKGGPGGRRGGRPAELVVVAPDGSSVEAQNGNMGRYRSTFDVHLKQKGTYRIAAINEILFASYKLAGESKRWRGTAESLAKEIPTGAEDLRVTEGYNRVEVFVTSGKPTDTALKSTGKGLELLPITHPNDLMVGETVKFRFVADGKPAANMAVKVIPGGIRYRDKLGEMDFKTDGEGVLSLKVEAPGMYWLNASMDDLPSTIDKAKRRVGYVATLEFLPQ
jgi:uncharacterized GH25 family protein